MLRVTQQATQNIDPIVASPMMRSTPAATRILVLNISSLPTTGKVRSMFVIFNLYALVGIGSVFASAFAAEAVGIPSHAGWLVGAIVDLGLRFSNRQARPKKKGSRKKKKKKGPDPWTSAETGGQLFWVFPVWVPCLIMFMISLALLST